MLASNHLDFQFRKVQFREGDYKQANHGADFQFRKVQFRERDTNAYPQPNLHFQFRKVQFRAPRFAVCYVELALSIPQGPIQSNEDQWELSERALLSIPQGPIQRLCFGGLE